MTREKVFNMKFSKVYLCLVNKALKKGRTRAEVDEVTSWLTGYRAEQISQMEHSDITYQEFFEQAPQLNDNRKCIKGKICGIRIESIEDPLMQNIRYLDKLVDELAKGRPIEKILQF
ncbi:DUF2200 domain-containing protein [Hespellia stercorisuis]|uniref:DUF2200 domain-containing protein n=1 Tax=Hespellia stercorisuis DSM 15480 TaxID=1121950 RepID=A0A1M6I7V0_9FIRM|nr:DUF2200 domain-containing protein [Hespellia stercorisuis]SHJ30492.1 hypothetical protein SAMN02745243_00263 [Hespellia stercorisuis DSM 15480]